MMIVTFMRSRSSARQRFATPSSVIPSEAAAPRAMRPTPRRYRPVSSWSMALRARSDWSR